MYFKYTVFILIQLLEPRILNSSIWPVKYIEVREEVSFTTGKKIPTLFNGSCFTTKAGL